MPNMPTSSAWFTETYLSRPLSDMRTLGPQSARFQQMLGEQFSVGGDSAKAVNAFSRAIQADPKLAGSHLALSILYLREGKRDQALAEIDKELEIAPESAVAKRVRQAIAQSGKGKLVDETGEHVPHRFRVSLFTLGAQEPVPGLPHATPVMEQLQEAPLPASDKDRASRALTRKDYVTVEQILVHAIEADAQSADLLALAARVFLLDKNPGNAAIALKKAEKLRPLSETDRFQLVMAYIGLKRSEWARPELDQPGPGFSTEPALLLLARANRLRRAQIRRLRSLASGP